MKTTKDVDSYIAESPKEVRATLIELRGVIKKAAPGASERISYGMPFYEYGGAGYKGRLVYFAVFKKHISLFIIPRNEAVPAELAKYHAGKATYRFPLDRPIPFTLIGKTVRALVRERDKANKSDDKPLSRKKSR
jgi:uncharacterized protein YdhG (YjbR/CyaY superfamily)